MDETAKKITAAWRQRGFVDGEAGRVARTPIRDDDGEAARAYTEGYRHGRRRREAK